MAALYAETDTKAENAFQSAEKVQSMLTYQIDMTLQRRQIYLYISLRPKVLISPLFIAIRNAGHISQNGINDCCSEDNYIL